MAIADAALTAVPITFKATHGVTFNGIIGSFADADLGQTNALDYKITITWGDKTATSSGTATFNKSTKRWDVHGSHKYAAKGTFKLSILVQDGFPSGSTATIASTATVA